MILRGWLIRCRECGVLYEAEEGDYARGYLTKREALAADKAHQAQHAEIERDAGGRRRRELEAARKRQELYVAAAREFHDYFQSRWPAEIARLKAEGKIPETEPDQPPARARRRV